MKLNEQYEEILEALWIDFIENKNTVCKTSLLENGEVIENMIEHYLIEVKDNNIRLTEAGIEEGRNCVRRHRLAERLLADIFVYNQQHLHEAGCEFEHLLHKGMDENICILLGHPKTCPHGKPIPQGDCCTDLKKRPNKLIFPLKESEINRREVVTHLQTANRNTLQKIIAMGMLPGSEVILIQKFPSFVIENGKSHFAIDEELASHIYVKTIL